MGRTTPYSPDEEQFVRSAIRALISRAAQVEYGLDPTRKKITHDDL